MLSARLSAIVNLVQKADVVADVGCDHGYAAQALIEQGRAKKVIACDISEPSLEKARTLVRSTGLQDQVETRLGDGFSVLEKGEADVVIIAGMGGMLIRTLLQTNHEKAQATKMMVFAPNRSEYELRKYLNEEGYTIVDEAIAKENDKFYQIICASPGQDKAEQDDFYFHVGRKLIEKKDPLLKEFLQQRIAEIERILIMAQKSTDADKLVAQATERKQRMEEVIQCL